MTTTKEDKVQQLLEKTGTRKELASLFNQLRELNEIIGGKDDSKELDDCRSEIDSNFSAMCDECFSEEELDDILAFLQSLAERKLVKLLPKLQESASKSVGDFLERKVERDMEEMISRVGDDEAVPPGLKVVGVVVTTITERYPEEVELKTGKTIPRNYG